MVRKYAISYDEVTSPITTPVTKFGGQPVWLEEPRWPLSRMYGSPMQFICQIALDPILFGNLPTRMAYLFITDWDYEGLLPDTSNPDGGENALILQPGGTWSGPALPLYEGPSLYRRAHRNGRWEQTPCELDVALRLGEDPDAGTWDDVDSDDKEAWDAYFSALCEDKIGGTPVPTINNAGKLAALTAEWRLLLQLNAKDNEGNGDPFFLNLSYDGVGYAFISPDGRTGRFVWSR
jgi:hypothetical protein